MKDYRLQISIVICSLSIVFSSWATTIKGIVNDSSNNKPLELVNVYLEGTKYGNVTNSDGYYTISNTPGGNYRIVFSMIGYEVIKKAVFVGEDEVLIVNALLSPKPIKLKDVTVSSRRTEFEKDVGVSSMKISIRDIKKMPSFVQSDLFRIIQTIPGVVTVGEFSTALYVRGGNCDQNLIQLDGATIFNPLHLGGFFSVFEVDAVENAEFIAGGFPAKFGNRLSSVLDVSTKTGSTERFKGTGAIGLLYSKLILEGPLPKGSFLISGRRVYLDKILPIFHVDFPYYFYDIQPKLNFPISDNTKISASGFCSHDVFDFGEGGSRIYMGWDNRAASLSLVHIFGPRFFSQSYITYSGFSYNANVASGLFSVDDSVQEWAIKNDLAYRINAHEIEFGVEAKKTDFVYKTNFQGGFKYDVTAIPYEVALYWQDKLKIGDKIILEAGLRLNYFWSEYKGMSEKLAKYFRPAPRFAFKYFLSPDMALKGACGKYFQFVTALIPEENPATFLFPWAPVFGKYKPEQSWHYIVGVEKWISEATTISIESYYKTFDNLLTFNQQAEPQDFVTNIFYVGNGNSYGIDMLLQQRIGQISGWLGYSASKARVTFNNINYPPFYDRNHNLNFIVEVKPRKNITFSAKFTYGSGTPYTPIEGWYPYYYIDPRTGEVKKGLKAMKGPKNSARFPDYHRLDIGVVREFKWKTLNLSLALGIINVYNHRSVILHFYDPTYFPPMPIELYTIPIVPSLELHITFP